MEGYCREGQDYQSCSAIEEEGIDGRIMFKWIFKKSYGGVAWRGLIWLRIWAGGGLFVSAVMYLRISIKFPEFRH